MGNAGQIEGESGAEHQQGVNMSCPHCGTTFMLPVRWKAPEAGCPLCAKPFGIPKHVQNQLRDMRHRAKEAKRQKAHELKNSERERIRAKKAARLAEKNAAMAAEKVKPTVDAEEAVADESKGADKSRKRIPVAALIAIPIVITVIAVGAVLFAGSRKTGSEDALSLETFSDTSVDSLFPQSETSSQRRAATEAEGEPVAAKVDDSHLDEPIERAAQSPSQSRPQRPNHDGNIQDFLPELQRGIAVNGTVGFAVRSKTVGLQRYTFQLTQVFLSLDNPTPYSFSLGQNLMLIETGDANKYEYAGVLVGVRMPRDTEGSPWENRTSYGLRTVETFFTDGSRFTSGDIISMLVLNQASDAALQQNDVVPSEIPAQSQVKLRMTLQRGDWIEPQNVRNVLMALPEINVTGAHEMQRFRLLVAFRRVAASAENAELGVPWVVSAHRWIRVDADTLRSIISDDEADFVVRILAANWLMELNPPTAIPALVDAAKPLTDGPLIITCFDLLRQQKHPGLAERGAELLRGRNTPPGIRIMAAYYLVELGEDPDMTPLVQQARGADYETTRLTIRALGNLETHRSVAALQTLLNDNAMAGWRYQIQANLDKEGNRRLLERGQQSEPQRTETE